MFVEHAKPAFPSGSEQNGVAWEMCAIFVIEIHFSSIKSLDAGSMDVNIFRDQGPEISKVTATSSSILPDNTQWRTNVSIFGVGFDR